tara:strand:+ start:2409 stop:2564 length:156 start_codon:yes stop_codon:yes gene_type:complete
MAKSLDKVLQSDGSYKWELVEHASEASTEKTKKPAKKAVKAETTTKTSTEK